MPRTTQRTHQFYSGIPERSVSETRIVEVHISARHKKLANSDEKCSALVASPANSIWPISCRHTCSTYMWSWPTGVFLWSLEVLANLTGDKAHQSSLICYAFIGHKDLVFYNQNIICINRAKARRAQTEKATLPTLRALILGYYTSDFLVLNTSTSN